MSSKFLEILRIQKKFVNDYAVKDLSLTINEGEFFSLLGPSGCGKTTLLRIIAGLEQQTAGEIHLNGERIDQLPAQKRPFNMVFQRYALFPHMSVSENVAFGLNIKKLPADQVSKRVSDALDMVGMKSFSSRMPETLSGGQQQRIAVARALVNRPKVLLLDEPLSALDQKMREHMQTELRILQKDLGLTFIYVTHDQEEAFALSDRIAVMNKGELVQLSSPQELYEKPASLFAAQFIGQMNLFPGEHFNQPNSMIGLRPERLQIATDNSNPTIDGIVAQSIFRGNKVEIIFINEKFGRTRVVLAVDHASAKLTVGQKISLGYFSKDLLSFENE